MVFLTTLSLIGFLLHKDIKYETLDKKFQYYQENRDEYSELKRWLKGFVVGSSIHNFFDPIDSVDEYMEIVKGLGQSATSVFF